MGFSIDIIKILSNYYKNKNPNFIQNNYCHKLVPQIDRIDKLDQQGSRPMKQLFFEKGQKEQFSPNGQYLIQTSNNLDSKKYILERIPIEQFQKEQNYISKHFYFSREDNLISYFTCWKQQEQIPIQKTIAKEKEKKKEKRTMLDVMKRKTLKDTQQTLPPSKKKINEDPSSYNFVLQSFVYVQMEYFSHIQIPNDFANLRDFIVIIYLLARRVQDKTGFVPCMIPVKNEQNDRIKFFKKGISLQIQLCKLMVYAFKDRQEFYLKQWSQTLQKAIHKAMINRDEHLVGILLEKAIQEYISRPYQICLIKEEKKVCSIESVRIIDYKTLLLEQSQIQLPLDEYTIFYLIKSESDREITLTHEVFENYTLSGGCSIWRPDPEVCFSRNTKNFLTEKIFELKDLKTIPNEDIRTKRCKDDPKC